MKKSSCLLDRSRLRVNSASGGQRAALPHVVDRVSARAFALFRSELTVTSLAWPWAAQPIRCDARGCGLRWGTVLFVIWISAVPARFDPPSAPTQSRAGLLLERSNNSQAPTWLRWSPRVGFLSCQGDRTGGLKPYRR